MKKTQKWTKLTAVFLAVLMIAMTLPFALAADEPVTLSRLNVYQWPEIEGEMTCGQLTSEAVTIVKQGIMTTDGTADGEVIPGTFAVWDISEKPPRVSSETNRVLFSFTPDDLSAYAEVIRLSNPSITVPYHKVTPVLVDPENDPVVASAVMPGDRLGKSTLSGGQCMNPLYPDEPAILECDWGWVDNDLIVEESGYYEAKFLSTSGYNKIPNQMVWVEVFSDVENTELINVPAEVNMVYNGITTLNDIISQYGIKAVVEGTDTEVAGTYAFYANASTQIDGNKLLNAGNYAYTLTFIPDDATGYTTVSAPVSFTITKGVPQWKDNVTPVVTVPYGTRVNSSIFYDLMKDGSLVPSDAFHSCALCDSEGNRINGSVLDVGTYEGVYMLELIENQNWQSALLPVTVVVTPSEVEMKVTYGSRTHRLRVECPTRLLEGTIDVYIDGQLVFDDAELAESEVLINANLLEFETTWKPANRTVNSTHDIKVVYNPTPTDQMGVVNGGCEISALYEADRKISVSDKQFDLYNDMKGFDVEKDILYAGDEVTVITSDTEFISWKITDAAGNPVAVEAIEGDVNASRFTFAMPELDLHIDYVTQYDLDHPEGNEDPESGNAFLDFLVRIINALRKVLQMLANILNLAQ